jgi:hypothetical protein
MPSYQASVRNLASARVTGRSPRRWRSNEESHMIRRFVFRWLTCGDARRPSGRAWAQALGVSHTWVQKLVRRFQVDPTEVKREVQECGHPTFAQLRAARDRSQQMQDRGELRRNARNRVASGRDAILMSLPAGEMDSDYRQAILRAEHSEQYEQNLVHELNLVHEFEYDY